MVLEDNIVQRSYGRDKNKLRPVSLTRDVAKNAQGSCMVEFGDTHVLCCATLEEGVPGWRKSSHQGWVTAEYAMLPCSTGRRTRREQGKRKGRSMEIERLIGRSLRTCVDMKLMGEYTLTVDCDVIQADGGTRTASITGAWVAMHDCFMKAIDDGIIKRLPIKSQVAAVSMGKVAGELLLDLDYSEDSRADVDLNLVGTQDNKIIEIQGTGEKMAFDREELNSLLDMGQDAIEVLLDLQNQVTGFLD